MSTESFLKTTQGLTQIKTQLEELLNLNVSNLSIDFEWSAIPDVKEHLEFLLQQVSGLQRSLKDVAPPEIHKVTMEEENNV
jgi:hypothetical protein